MEPWSLEELSNAFQIFATQGHLKTKFCFFVDGLDEYDGEHTELIASLQTLADSPSVKLCVSSRPWNVFLEAFNEHNERKMILQDYTKMDIRLYTKDQLEKDARFSKLTREDSGYRSLVEEIVRKAQGVFLWVFLVVRSLLRGLTDGNDIATLQQRLRRLPQDLEQYFKQIFATVEDFYREQTGEIFQLMITAKSPLSTLTFHFLQKEKAEPGFSIKAPIEPLTDTEIENISNKIRQYLNARCKDLVEVNENRNDPLQRGKIPSRLFT